MHQSYDDVASTCILLSDDLMPKLDGDGSDEEQASAATGAVRRLKRSAAFLEGVFVAYVTRTAARDCPPNRTADVTCLPDVRGGAAT